MEEKEAKIAQLIEELQKHQNGNTPIDLSTRRGQSLPTLQHGNEVPNPTAGGSDVLMCTPVLSSSSSADRDWRNEYVTLVHKHNKFAEGYRDLKAVNSELHKVIKRKTAKESAWVDYSKQLELIAAKRQQLIGELRAQLSSASNSIEQVKEAREPNPSRTKIEAGSPVQRPDRYEPENPDSEETLPDPNLFLASPQVPIRMPEALVEDSRFAELGFDYQPPDSTPGLYKVQAKGAIKSEEAVDVQADDCPVFVSVRSVRKRKERDSAVEQPVSSVKVEPLNSSPLGLAGIHSLHDSLDLDEVGHVMPTPKKPRRKYLSGDERFARSRAHRSKDYGHDLPDPFPVQQSPRSTPVILAPLSNNQRTLPQTMAHQRQRDGRRRGDISVADIAEDGEDEACNSRPGNSSLLEGLLAKPALPNPVLIPPQSHLDHAPKSPMIALPSNPSTTDNDLRESIPRDNVSVGLQHIGSPGPLQVSKAKASSSTAGSRSPNSPKAWTLRESIERPDVSSTVSSTSAPFTRPSSSMKANVARQSLTAKLSASRKGILRVQEKEIKPDDEPLRAMSVERLNLSDFRINPKYNPGFKHAHNNVVRGKVARQCLPGCRRDCCRNQFLALANAMRPPGHVVTPSQAEADDRLLENYLGGTSYKIPTMKQHEREDQLLAARAWKIGKDSGKHKAKFQRRTTPPGFWDTDFPSTQEAIVQRQKEEEAIRAKVEERYAEAMRPGGQFIFRDEV